MTKSNAFHNRRWALKKRPNGIPTPQDFELREELISASDLQPGQVLAHNLYTICAPDQRNWMNEQINFHPPLKLGDTILGPTVSRIVASRHPSYSEGTLAFTLGGWCDYAAIDIASLYVPLITYPDTVTPFDALAVIGINQLTAYFGVNKVCRPEPGEVMVVSGAAGSTGSAAAQIGKIKGCHVIGIAGGRDKCSWLLDTCGLDEVIDYKAENVEQRLRALCGDKINMFYDNVGGDILQAALNNMAFHGRIALCGMISGYTGAGNIKGPDNFMRMVHGALRMEGFTPLLWHSEFPQAIAEIKSWVDQGRLKHREDLREGLENLPEIYPDLYRGKNIGTLIVKLADGA